MNDLHIEWKPGGWNGKESRGEMNIHMDKFFPCSMEKFKKLLKVIALDWEHEEAIRETLKNYFQNRIPKLPDEAEALQKKAAEYREKAKEAKRLFNRERKRIHNGGKPPYLESKYDNEFLNNKYAAMEAERKAKQLIKAKTTFEKYLELL